MEAVVLVSISMPDPKRNWMLGVHCTGERIKEKDQIELFLRILFSGSSVNRISSRAAGRTAAAASIYRI